MKKEKKERKEKKEKRRREKRRREKKREEEKTNTRDIRDTTDRRDRMTEETEENRRDTGIRDTTDKEEPRATTTIKQQSKLPNVRFTLRDHVPRQPLLPTDPNSAVQHQFRVGRVVGGVVLQQFYSFSVQLCL